MSMDPTNLNQAPQQDTPGGANPNTAPPTAPNGAGGIVNAAGPTTPASPAPTQGTPPPTSDPNHPSSFFHRILETIGGGPKVKYSTDENGNVQKTEVPTSNGDLAKTILAGAMTGLFASAGKRGPGAALQAFGAGGQAVQEQTQKADAEKRGQAQQNFQNNQAEQLKKAQIADTNARVIMNTLQNEKLQGEALDDYIQTAQPTLTSLSGLADGDHLSQAEVMDGLKSGKYHTLGNLFVPDGKVQKIGPDGAPVIGKSGLPEMELTYTHVNDGQVPLSQDVYNAAADAGLPKFTPGTKVASNQMVSASQLLGYQQQIAAVHTAQYEVQAVRKGLGIKGDLDWGAVKKTPGMATALMKFQGYMHAAGDDPQVAIQQMSAEKQDPKTGRMIANPDAKFAGLVSQAFGGDDVLRKYHDKIASDNEQAKEFGKTQGGLPAAITKDVEVQRRQLALLDARERYKADQADVAGKFNIQPTDSPEQVLSKIPREWAIDVKKLANYEANPKTFTTNPRKSGGLSRDQAYALASMINPSFDDTQYKVRQDMRNDYTTGKTAFNTRAIGTAVHHMAALNESQKNLNSFGFSSLNTVKEGLTPSFASGSQKKTQEDINAVTSEVANVFAGKGANIPELDSWKKSIKSTASHAEFQAWIQEGMKLMAGRAQQIAGDWQKGMGQTYDFNILTPGVKAELKNLPGGDALLQNIDITKGGAGGGFDHTQFPKAN